MADNSPAVSQITLPLKQLKMLNKIVFKNISKSIAELTSKESSLLRPKLNQELKFRAVS